MKLLATQISPLINSFLHIESREQPYLCSPYYGSPSFHSHPEFELLFITKGFGKRIIGSNISKFEPNDMVFLGSWVPHIWLSDPAFYKADSNLISATIIAYIHPDVFEFMLNNVDELKEIKQMLEQSRRGIYIYGKTRNEIADRLIYLSSMTGFARIEGLLHIMYLIATSSEKSYILNDDPAISIGDTDRMNEVIEYIKNNIEKEITLKQVADLACLTMPSFCRSFKIRTRMTFCQYLSEVRILHACKLLIEMDQSVSYIANMCGYKSDSHFCKVFKERIGQSPYQYKSSVKKSSSLTFK
ncbi:MAG: AraC family transcriptional regulator [Ginsengibacter sp.]